MSRRKKYLLGFIFLLLIIAVFVFRQRLEVIANQFSLPRQYKNYTILAKEEKQIDFYSLKYGSKKMISKIMVINNIIDEPTVLGLSKIILVREDGYLLELPGHGEGFIWWRVGDFNGNGNLDIAVMYESMGSESFNPFYFYEWNGENFEIKLKNDDLFNEDKMVDLDNNGIWEIKHIYRLSKFAFPWEDIYKWDKQKNEYILADSLFPNNYERWLNDIKNYYSIKFPDNPDIYSPPDGEYLKEINTCLIEKANKFIKGIFGNIDECKMKIEEIKLYR